MKSIAVVRLKGQINLNGQVKDTLNMLKLYRKNYCSVFEARPEIMGMVKKVKDFVAWGEISEEEKNKLPKSFKLAHIKKAKTGNQKEKIMDIIKQK
ncbi:uL30 family ribosomal protein [Candidatus Woesearchaeota archaeon]|nr:uL30 family ribosomal protein [Candidatus Woesearchaeota archaeon]